MKINHFALRITQFTIALIMLLLLLMLGNNTSLAQDHGWSTPQILSNESQSSWFPDVAIDASGRIHVVWSSLISTGVGQAYDTVMYTTRKTGQAWTQPIDIAAIKTKGAVTRATLLPDQKGILHMTYRSYSLFYTQGPAQNIAANTLATPFLVSTPENGYFSRMVSDADGRIHLFFSANIYDNNCPGCFHIFYRQSTDGGQTWTEAVDVSRQITGAAKPQAVIDRNNVIHVVWEAGEGGDLGQIPDPTSVVYASSSDLGETWSTPYEFPAPGGRARNISIGRFGNNQLIVVYLGLPENIVYYQLSNNSGKTWGPPSPITGILGGNSLYPAHTDDYAMVSDETGDVHLALVGQLADKRFDAIDPSAEAALTSTPTHTLTPTQSVSTATPENSLSLLPTTPPTPIKEALNVLYLSWNGSKWSQPEVVASFRGDAPEWPRLAIGLGNQLQLVWFVRDEAHIWGGDGAFRYRVWYSNKTITAPAATPVEWNDLFIAAESTPTAQESGIMPTRTGVTPSLATITPSQLSNRPLIYNERGYLFIVGVSLVPVLLLLGIFIIILRIRNR